MEHLIKVAQYGTRLEKIAAIVDELAQARDEYEAAEILGLAEEMGIHPAEVEQAIPLFKEASEAMYDPTEELVKIATEIVDDPYATPLEKVAAMVDGVVAGAFDPEAVYGAAAELGFAPEDVDFIYETAYLGKEAKDSSKGKEKSAWVKFRDGAKDWATFRDVREGWSGDKKEWGKIAKGVGKGAAVYGPLAAGAYYGYKKYRED